jgi:hypothetical protein
MRRIAWIACVLWLCTTAIANAADWGAVGLVVSNAPALTDQNIRQLWTLLTTVPRPLWTSLETISIDGVGFDNQNLHGINCLSQNDTWTDNPFPPDAPGVHIRPTGFYAICSHELTHHLPVTAAHDRPWLNAWAARLIAEAGCDATHYLRSMIPDCYFRDNPQEFIASMGNQWMADSAEVWRLAYTRWQQGNPHPANQAVLLTAWYSLVPPVSPPTWATVAAFQYAPTGVRLMPWQLVPWRCGGEVRMTGESVRVQITLNEDCRVTALEVQ